MNSSLKKRYAVAALLFAASMPVTADVVESVSSPKAAEVLPTDQEQLPEIVAALDRRMFDAYNAHDLDKLMAMFAPDLEFYHDTGGLVGYEQVREGFRGIFANNKDIRRDLVAGSLEVYPIKGHERSKSASIASVTPRMARTTAGLSGSCTSGDSRMVPGRPRVSSATGTSYGDRRRLHARFGSGVEWAPAPGSNVWGVGEYF
jgi:hypothetical protein